MSGEIIEEIFSGYCKSKNLTQSIICEYEQLACGLSLLSVSCDFEKCLYNKDCTVVQQALAKEDE
ncbi:MAG: ubiquinone biosynthesis protein UbiE [Eubacteriales bacterium]|nr:ubiquinone biosynthesis protein UbiE [Eubacteriales bacterium]